MSYEPQPGTIAHRVILWLRAQAKATGNPEAEYGTGEVCEALDLELEGFVPFLRTSRDHGLIHTRHVMTDTRRLVLRLGDGSPDPCVWKRRPPVVHRPPPATIPAPPPAFRALQWEGCVFVTGMEIRDGVAIFSPEQIRALKSHPALATA